MLLGLLIQKRIKVEEPTREKKMKKLIKLTTNVLEELDIKNFSKE